MVKYLFVTIFVIFSICSYGTSEIECENEALQELSELLQTDGKGVLSKQYALTTLKLATLNSKRTTVEKSIRDQQKELNTKDPELIKRLNQIYTKHGLNYDYQKLIENMESTLYWKKESRFYNEDISAFLLLKQESDPKSQFSTTDAAIAWMAEKTSKLLAKKNGKNSSSANLTNMSTQVAFINGRINQNKKLTDEELKEKVSELTESIEKDMRALLTHFSPAFLEKCQSYIDSVCNNTNLLKQLFGESIFKIKESADVGALSSPLLKNKLKKLLSSTPIEFKIPQPRPVEQKLFHAPTDIPTVAKSSIYRVMQRFKEEVNGKDDTHLLQSYHKNFMPSRYGVIDKSAQTLKVYNSDGQMLIQVSTAAKFPDSDKAPPGIGAGIFYLNSTFPDHQMNLSSQRGKRVRLEINHVEAECTANNECQSSNPDDMKIIYKYLSPSDPIYVLPSEDGNTFVVKNGLVNFTTLVPRSTYGQYNYSPKDKTCHPIETYIKEPSYNTPTAKTFLKKLADEKSELMKMYGLDNDEYNDLTKLAFGILGNESQFGSSKRYFIKESLPFAVSLAKGNMFDTSQNSRGPTQIKSVPKKIQEKYGVKKETLKDPANAAVATLGFLAEALQELKGKEKLARENGLEINSLNRMNYVHYIYMGRSAQVTSGTATPDQNIYFRQIKKYADELLIVQSDTPGDKS